MLDQPAKTANPNKKRLAKSSSTSAIKEQQSARLQMLAISAGLSTQAALAAASGINFQTIGSYWSGHRRITDTPPDLNASRIVAALNAANPKRATTVKYLMTGEGPMYIEPSVSSARLE